MQLPKLRDDELVPESDEGARLDEIDALGERGYRLMLLAATWIALEEAGRDLPRDKNKMNELRAAFAAIRMQQARIEAELLPALDDLPESTMKAEIAASILAWDLGGTPFAKALLESAARDIDRFDDRFPKAA